jgi:hypothetical protein
MASPALDLLLRYQDDPSLQPGTEDLSRTGFSQGVRDTILRGRKIGGRITEGKRLQNARENRMDELDQFLTFRERLNQRDDMISRGLMTAGSHQSLNFFQDLWSGSRYGKQRQPSGMVIPPFMAGGFR